MNFQYTYKVPLSNKGYDVSKVTWEGREVVGISKNNVEVYASDYINCCGSLILFEISLYEEKDVDEAAELVKAVIKTVLKHENRNHVSYISMESGQELVNEVLTKVGFKQVDTFRNSNTGNVCILWSLNSTTI